jgi:hypothetical protein
MFDVRRGAKKFLVANFTDGTGTVGFYSLRAARAPFPVMDFFEAIPLLAVLQDTFKFV